MNKPWDKLRSPVKAPIGNGSWQTSHKHNPVTITYAYAGVGRISGMPCLRIVFDNVYFAPSELREIAEFFTELADQLEAGG